MRDLDDRLCDIANEIPCGKILLAIVSFLPFWVVLDTQVAIMVFGGLVIHEFGHALAGKVVSVPVMGIYILPRFNGMCCYERSPKTRRDWLIIVICGPVFEFIFGLILFGSGISTGSKSLILSSSLVMFSLIGFSILPNRLNDGWKILDIVEKPLRLSGLSSKERTLVYGAYFLMLTLSVAIVASVILTPLLNLSLAFQFLLFIFWTILWPKILCCLE